MQGTRTPTDVDGMATTPKPSRRRRLAGDRGAGLVEYALLIALIALACVGALVYFGQQGENSVNHSKDCIINEDPTC
jgi:uncharacterized protein HemX